MGVTTGVKVAVAVAVGVLVGVGLGGTVAVAVAVAVAVGVGDGVPANVAVAVGVGVTGVKVVTVKVQPPAKLPWSPFPSSKTNKDQVPLAVPPLKVDKVVTYGPAGAGAGNVSVGG